MSKRFTTFLVLAAAMLLAIPAQGQTIVKKSAAKQTAIQTMTPSAKEFKATKDAYLKATDKTVGALLPLRLPYRRLLRTTRS